MKRTLSIKEPWLKGKRIFEGMALVFGKGLWLKILADYSGHLYVFYFAISKTFHVSISYNFPSFLRDTPRWEFSLSVLGKKIVETAKNYYVSLHEWCAKDNESRRAKAKDAKKKLEQQGLLDQAKDYTSGHYLLKD